MEMGTYFGIKALGTDVCSHQLSFCYSTVVVLFLTLKGDPRNLFAPLGNMLLKKIKKAHGSPSYNDHMVDDLWRGITSNSPLSLKPPASLEAATHIG